MDIYINGEIDKNTVDMSALKGVITVHINSLGGDTFAALAIHDALKKCNAKAIIEGVCGSAATIIACGCKTVTMCENALYMIHNTVAELWSDYDIEGLEKIKNSLEKVQSTIVNIYVEKTGKSPAEIEMIMGAETWYNATEAKLAGFVDLIEGVADTDLDGDILISNAIKFSCSKYNKNAIRQKVNTREHILNMERMRIKNLAARKSGNKYIDTLIDTAIENGDDIKKVEKYIAALKKVSVSSRMDNIFRDGITSGVENVMGAGESLSPEEIRIKRIAAYANEGR